MNRVLVTGGAGYIGGHTCLALVEAGFDPVIIDNFSNSHPEMLTRLNALCEREIPFHRLDVSQPQALRQVFEQWEFDAVLHFAGLKAVGESTQQPLRYYHCNVAGSLNLLTLMAEFGVKNLIFSSSATVYGDPHQVPILESFPTSATNPYGRSKLMVETMLQEHGQVAGQAWKISLLRYFNPIGAHASGQIGEDPTDIPNNLVPYIARVAIGTLPKLSIFGDDYPTRDGTGIRDYIHVVDLARGHVCALRQLATAPPGCTAYNLGTGSGYSVLEVKRAFEKVSRREIPHQVVARRPGDIAECYADPTLAAKQLNWRAEFDLERMMEDTWRWQRQNPKGYRG